MLAMGEITKENYPVAVATVSPNRGTPNSSREPAYRRTDAAEPRWNSHCQDGPFEGEARPHAACPNVVDIVAWGPPDRDPKRAARPRQRAIPRI